MLYLGTASFPTCSLPSVLGHSATVFVSDSITSPQPCSLLSCLFVLRVTQGTVASYVVPYGRSSPLPDPIRAQRHICVGFIMAVTMQYYSRGERSVLKDSGKWLIIPLSVLLYLACSPAVSAIPRTTVCYSCSDLCTGPVLIVIHRPPLH
jgi:hypothetical protein